MIVFDDCKKYSVKGPKRKTGLVKSVFRDLGVERGRVRPETENYKHWFSRPGQVSVHRLSQVWPRAFRDIKL